jgi:uroporphyrinogen-III synthase
MTPPLLLLTRPEAQSRAFAARLSGTHEVRIAPLTEIEPVDWDRSLADGVRGVILTSANAVPAVSYLAPLDAWCVGEATARVAAAAGFRAHAAAGDAVALVADLRRLRPEGPLLHAHGLHLARDMGAALEPMGLTVRSAVVYAARMVPWPSDLPQSLAGRRVIAPVFSPRAAAELSARMPDPPAGLMLIAISRAAADRLSDALRGHAMVIDTPEQMTQAVRSHLVPQP